MTDDAQQEAAPPQDARPDSDRKDAEQRERAEPRAREADSGRSGHPDDDNQPDQFLDPRNVERITNVWHQYNVSVQQIGTVFGGRVSGSATATMGSGSRRDDRDRHICVKVRAAELERIRAVHVPSQPAHEWARAILAEHAVVILHGRARWGKTSTALRLLDERHPAEVHILGRDSRFPQIDPGLLEAGKGYFIECLEPDSAAHMSLEALMHLSEQLITLNSHLVVTVDGLVPLRAHAFRSYLVVCDNLPDPRSVLEQNLRWRLRDTDCDVEVLVREEWVRVELDRHPHPARLDALASVLESIARNEREAAQGPEVYRGLLAGLVAEWFETHAGLRERCLMLAIAVLNEASYQEIADAARRLYRLLERPKTSERLHRLLELGREEDEEHEELPGLGWERSSSRRRRVQDCCAELVCELEPTTIGDLPVELVRLEDPNLQPAVLQHVWAEHDGVRSKLLEWFEWLGAHPSPEVRGRAAAAVGSLAQRDFRYFNERLIRRWARDERRWVRWSGAVALNVLAAAGAGSEQRVRGLLRDWIRLHGETPLGWTAVAAYGFELGQKIPDAALVDLLKVVRRNPAALWIAGRTVASLCDRGNLDVSRRVLERLIYWSEQHRVPDLPHRMLTVFLYAAGELAVGQQGQPRPGPVLLWVAAEEKDLRPAIATLWERALAREELRKRAGGTLQRWLDRGADHPQLSPAVDDLFAALRCSGRAQAVTRRLLVEWDSDPLLPSPAAARYLSSFNSMEVSR